MEITQFDIFEGEDCQISSAHLQFYFLHFHLNFVLIYNVYIYGCIFCCLQLELNNFIEIELTKIK